MTATGATTATLLRPQAVDRLAELVAHLAGCPAPAAVEAVAASLDDPEAELSADERLAVVARALLLVRHDVGHGRPA